MILNTISFKKYQALVGLYLLTMLIPGDDHFDSALSLALDRALLDFEAAA
jgi:hypothetical protein